MAIACLVVGAEMSEASAAPPDEQPSCLDQSIASELSAQLERRGVQRRDFLKVHQVELVARGGLLAGDLLSSSYTVGGALSFFATEDLGVEFGLDITNVDLKLDSAVADFFGDDRFEGGRAYLAMLGLLWSPIHAKMKVGGSIVHADILLAAGAGRLFHDSSQGIGFNAGAILELYVTRWVTLRFDLRDVVLVQEAVGETRLTNNIMTTLGLALWIPTGL